LFNLFSGTSKTNSRLRSIGKKVFEVKEIKTGEFGVEFVD